MMVEAVIMLRTVLSSSLSISYRYIYRERESVCVHVHPGVLRGRRSVLRVDWKSGRSVFAQSQPLPDVTSRYELIQLTGEGAVAIELENTLTERPDPQVGAPA